jgi:Flp pilus assembly protein TadD
VGFALRALLSLWKQQITRSFHKNIKGEMFAAKAARAFAAKQETEGGNCIRLRIIEALNVDMSVFASSPQKADLVALSVRVETLVGTRAPRRTTVLESAVIRPQNVVSEAGSSAGSSGADLASSAHGRGSRVVWNEEVDIRRLPNGMWPFISVTVFGHTTVPAQATPGKGRQAPHPYTAQVAGKPQHSVDGSRSTSGGSNFMSRLFNRGAGDARKLASVVIDCDVERLREASPLSVEQWHYMMTVVDGQENKKRGEENPITTTASPENGELRVSLVWLPSAADSHLAGRELTDRIITMCGSPLSTTTEWEHHSFSQSDVDLDLSSSASESGSEDDSDDVGSVHGSSGEATPNSQSQRTNFACMGNDRYYESSEQGSRGLTYSAELSLLSSLDQSLASGTDSVRTPANPTGGDGYDDSLVPMSMAAGLGASGTISTLPRVEPGAEKDSGYVDSGFDSISESDSARESSSTRDARQVSETKEARPRDSLGVSVRGVVKASSKSFNERFQVATERLHRLRSVNFHQDDTSSRMTALRETQAVNLELMQLYQDFLVVAQTYGRIIISEVALPVSEKTIRPVVSQVGTLGGQKFSIQGVVFKFASDRYNLFSGDMEAASKVAGHELKGLSAFFSWYGRFLFVCCFAFPYSLLTRFSPFFFWTSNIPGLCVPLCALIDYMGFRLVALAELPIRGGETLVNGSMNGGNTVKSLTGADDLLRRIHREATGSGARSKLLTGRVIEERLLRVSSMLNVLPHRVREISKRKRGKMVRSRWHGTKVYGPVDLEVHIGFDNRVYCLDFSRMFPPETPDPRIRSSHLYRLLRPEHCKRHPVPLCSDAFSSFILEHPHVAEYNQEAVHATNQLRSELPQFIHNSLVPRITVAQREGIPLHELRVDTLLHSAGINLRDIGLSIHTLLGNSPADEDELESSARSTPTRSRSESRESRSSIDVESSFDETTTLVAGNRHMVRDAVVLLVIEALARTVKEIWRRKMRVLALQLRGPRSSPFVALTAKLLNRVLGASPQADRFWEKLGVAVAEKFDVSLDVVLKVFDPTLSVRRFLSTVPHFSTSDGRLLLLHRLLDLTGIRLRSHLLKMLHHNPTRMDFRAEIVAYEDIKELAPRSKPMAIVSRAQGFMSLSHGLEEGNVNSFKQAITHLEAALRTQPNDVETLCLLAQTLFRLEVQQATERRLRELQASPDELPSTNPLHLDTAFIYSSNIERANHLFLRAISVDPANAESCMQYAYFLSRCNQPEKALEYHLQAVQHNPSHVGALAGLEQLLNRTNRQELAAMIAQRRKLQRAALAKQEG